jgi:methyl-accepting chemotaxis protein
MSMTGNRRKWRNILIHPRFQLRLALIHTGFVVLVLAVLIIALLSPLYFEIYGSKDLWVRYATAELLLHVLNRLGVVVLVITAISGVYHIVFSHRLCGPLVNIGHTLDSLARGDLRRKVFLRQKDYLQEEAQKINLIVGTLEARIGALKTSQDNLAAIAGQLDEGELKEKLRTLLAENKAVLDQWMVSPAAHSGAPDETR